MQTLLSQFGLRLSKYILLWLFKVQLIEYAISVINSNEHKSNLCLARDWLQQNGAFCNAVVIQKGRLVEAWLNQMNTLLLLSKAMNTNQILISHQIGCNKLVLFVMQWLIKREG